MDSFNFVVNARPFFVNNNNGNRIEVKFKTKNAMFNWQFNKYDAS